MESNESKISGTSANTNTLNMPVSGAIGTALVQPKQKITINITEVENGFVVHYSKGGYSWGEKTHIAKTTDEAVAIVHHLFD